MTPLARLIINLALYAVPFFMLYGATLLADQYGGIAVFCGFFAGIVYVFVREIAP